MRSIERSIERGFEPSAPGAVMSGEDSPQGSHLASRPHRAPEPMAEVPSDLRREPFLVLIVDDETVGIEVRRMLLERAGYRVVSALDGAAGLALFAAQPVAAVVLDFAMPGMNGGDVARSMRSIKPQVPILMLSAYTSLPPDIAELVDLSMTKGEGAPALLKKLGSLLWANASHTL